MKRPQTIAAAVLLLGGVAGCGSAGPEDTYKEILSVQKQPGADTVGLSERIDRTLAEIRAATPPGVEFDAQIFRQERFIHSAIANVIFAVTMLLAMLYVWLLWPRQRAAVTR